MAEPTLETFRKWLQLEIIEAEMMPESEDRNRRLIHLESALQESMAFEAAWKIRAEAEAQITQIDSSVRLVSAAPAESNQEQRTLNPMQAVACTRFNTLFQESLPH